MHARHSTQMASVPPSNSCRMMAVTSLLRPKSGVPRAAAAFDLAHRFSSATCH